MRTPRFIIVIRAVAIVFGIYMLFALAWNSITLSNQWSPLMMFTAALLTVSIYGGFGWVFVRIGMALLHGNDPEYHRFLRSGGDPYFASLPWPFNPNSHVTRVTGIQEPKTELVPPANWLFQCPRCGARVQHRIDICWNSGYGSDGDSTAYFEQNGDACPPEFTAEEWAEIRRGQGR